MEDYRTIRGTAVGEYEEKKSRFIAQLSFADSEEKAVVDAALAVEKVQKATEGMQIVKTILVKNRLVNLIVKPAK